MLGVTKVTLEKAIFSQVLDLYTSIGNTHPALETTVTLSQQHPLGVDASQSRNDICLKNWNI